MFRYNNILLALSCLMSSCSCYPATGDGSARTLQYDFQRQSEADYRFNYETSNGIKREETGDQIPSIHDANNNAARVRGSFSYPGPDGKMYSVTFLADEAGFHPEGEHLLIPPFTPWMPGQPIDDGQYVPDNSGQYKPDDSGRYRPESGDGQGSPVLDARNPESPSSFDFPQNPGSNNFNFPQNNAGANPGFQPESPTNNLGPDFPSTNPGFTQNNPGSQPQNGNDIESPMGINGEDQPNYTSGERILNAFRSTPQTTPKYLPTLEPQKTSYISGENILDTYLSPQKPPQAVTDKYLPTPEDDHRESSRPTPKYLPGFTTSTTETPLDSDLIQKAYFNKPTPHPEILLHSTPQ